MRIRGNWGGGGRGRARWVAIAAALAVVFGGAPAGAQAVCADHANQREAQIAKDTRDADGDGIYCEALPCPCLKPGQGDRGGGGSSPPAPVRAPSKPKKKRVAPRELDGVKITSVIDGDTVRARTRNGGYLKVRLIGIDAPEKSALRNGAPECGGQQATDALEAFRADYPMVTLVTDPTQDRYDQYGRLLAYIQADQAPDYTTYQTYMLANGWAEVYVYNDKPFRRTGAFDDAAFLAQDANLGVWSLCGGDFHLPITADQATPPATPTPVADVAPSADALPRMTITDAKDYIATALEHRFKGSWTNGHSKAIEWCTRVSETRIKCGRVTWIIGDTSYVGTASAWYSPADDGSGDIQWNYSWTITELDEYCASTGGKNCSRTHRVT
jgi:endonuclease YncB( thermonuclease family)